MNHKLVKYIGFFVAAFLISSLHAQKFDKKYKEKFKVNKNVELKINATNADIEVTTWNKNEVSIEAVITVEGLSKTEAEKFLNKWEFEALGNKTKVEINANANNFMHLGDHSFNFNFDNFNIPEINFENFKIDIQDIDFPEIDLENIWKDIHLEFKDGDVFSYEFDDDDSKKIIIKNKKEWEKFKKSKEYENLKNKLSGKKEKIRKELKEAKIKFEKIDKKKIEKKIEKAKLAYKKIDKEKIRLSLEKAKLAIEKMNLGFEKMKLNGNSIIIIEDGGSKKEVKITRTIKIKVPKGATFNLNTRHSKVKLPKGKTSGKVSYGSFNATDLDGGNLEVDYAPVTINSLNDCTLSLNNVTDAIIASVTNSNLTTNSSAVIIQNIHRNVDILSKFGEMKILNFSPNYINFTLNLDYTNTILNVSKINKKLKYVIEKKSPLYPNKAAMKFNLVDSNKKDINGNFIIKTNDETFIIKGKYSQLIISQ
tara:strand:- start:2940 stop:4379 length:1440 start_codon:yes stop_codon:yes gene_type:complete